MKPTINGKEARITTQLISGFTSGSQSEAVIKIRIEQDYPIQHPEIPEAVLAALCAHERNTERLGKFVRFAIATIPALEREAKAVRRTDEAAFQKLQTQIDELRQLLT